MAICIYHYITQPFIYSYVIIAVTTIKFSSIPGSVYINITVPWPVVSLFQIKHYKEVQLTIYWATLSPIEN